MPVAFKTFSAEVLGVYLNWKLASAFSAGAVLASGIVYFAVKPDAVQVSAPSMAPAVGAPTVSPPKRPAVARTETVAPQTVQTPAQTPVHVASPVHVPMPVREKPSPMPPPVRRMQDLVIAGNVPHLPQPPPPQVEPAPPAAEMPPPVPAAPALPAPEEHVPVQNVSLPTPAPESRAPHTVTLMAGTMLPVRVGETLSSARNQPGDTFLATLTQPLVIDGWVIAERGARVEGRVVDTTQAGRVKGVAHLGISIVRLATADGQNIRIRTEPYVKDGPTSTATDAGKIGAGAAIGAIIGAIAGGGKGAGIGAAAGGAAGAGDVLLTRGKPAEIPVETRVNLKVLESLTITERLD